jgi:hypothetical protein
VLVARSCRQKRRSLGVARPCNAAAAAAFVFFVIDRSFPVVVVFLAPIIARERLVLELSYPQQWRSFYKL